MRNARIAAAFVLTALAYILIFGTCLGSDTGTLLGNSCSAIGPLLKVPFLYAAPYAGSRYLGIDSALLIMILNTVAWGVFGAVVVGLISRRSSRRQGQS